MRVGVVIGQLLMVFGAGAAPALADVDLRGSIAAIRSVGPNGHNSQAAARAWEEVAQADVRQLPEVLAGMDGASTLACNWLRCAIDQIVEHATTANQPLPAGALETLVREPRHHPQARRLAYEMLSQIDRSAPERLLPGMLDDPSLEIRREAVARLLEQADQAFTSPKKTTALPLYRQALASARDKDQIDQAAKRLAELGQSVDLPAHLGLVLNWKLIGPFPNPDRKGADIAYPPEHGIDLTASYDGLDGKVHWKDHVTTQTTGIIDLNAAVAAPPAAIGYAFTEFTSRDAQSVEIRIGSYNGFKLWVNGELVLSRGDEFTGMRWDHYQGQVRLKPGKNAFLIKLCKNDHSFPIPKDWRFHLRVCDISGAGIVSATRPAPIAPAKKKSAT
jgi:hypothetical protein